MCSLYLQPMKEVKALGWFGRDIENVYIDEDDNNHSVVQYLRLPGGFRDITEMPTSYSLDPPWNLNITHPQDENRTRSLVTYEHIFKWIMRHEDVFKSNSCNFVCKRGDLSTLMIAKNSGFDNVIIATKLNGIIYFRKYWLDNYKLVNNKYLLNCSFPDVDRNITQTSKFKHYLLADEPNMEPKDPKEQSTRQYNSMACVFHVKVDDHKIIYSSNINGLPKENALKNLSNTDFVELKTTYRQKGLHKGAKLKYWAECYLTKTEIILMGIKNDCGMVTKLETVKVDSLISEEMKNECFDSLSQLLNVLKARTVDGMLTKFIWRNPTPFSRKFKVEPFSCDDACMEDLIPLFFK